MLSDQFMWFGALVVIAAGLGYLAATIRGRARPNRVSWGLWAITSWLAFAGQLDEQVGTAAVLTFAAALTPSLIFLGSFVGGAYWRFSRLDIVCLLLSLGAMLAWQITASGLVAIVLSIAVDAIAGVPTIVQAWRAPESESHLPYSAGIISAACTLLALDEFTVASAAFAIYFLSLCTILDVELLVVPPLRRVRITFLPRGAVPLPALPDTEMARSGAGHAVSNSWTDLDEPRPDRWRTSYAVAGPPLIGVLSAPPVDAANTGGADSGARPVAAPAEHPARRGRLSTLAGLVVLVAVVATGTLWLLVPAAPHLPTASVTFTTNHSGPAGTGRQLGGAPASSSPVARSIAVPTVHGTVPVGATPGHLEMAPNGRFALIAHREAGVVSVLDTTTNSITGVVPVPAGPPRFVAFSPDSERAYISVYDQAGTVNLIGVLDTTTMTIVATVPVGRRPFAAAVTPDGSQLWVPSHDDGRIDIIDTLSNSLVTSVPVPPNPHWVAFSDDGERAYIANHESNVVTVLDTATRTTAATIAVGVSPHSTAVATGHRQVAVANYDSDTISIIDPLSAATVTEVRVGRGPQDVAYAPDGRYLYSTNVDDDTVSVIDAATHTVTATIPACDGPTSVATHPSGRMAYITCVHTGAVMILDTSAN